MSRKGGEMWNRITGWWRRHVTLRNAQESSGHLDNSERSAEFQRVKKLPK